MKWNYYSSLTTLSSWLVQNKPHVNPPEARPRESSSLPRPRESPPQPPAGSRSRTGTDREPSLSVRSDDTKSPPSSSSESSHSSVSSVRLPRTSRPTFDSSRRPSLPSRKPPKPTSSASSKTPTCAPSTPSVSPSCQRTFSWHDESVASEHNSFSLFFW